MLDVLQGFLSSDDYKVVVKGKVNVPDSIFLKVSKVHKNPYYRRNYWNIAESLFLEDF